MISGYRGGYKPLERKAIEEKMINGTIRGLVSTNALELGIDIGTVDTVVLVGYPGTRASFWQQSGRAGRKGNDSDIYLILDNRPFDQYIAYDPSWLFDGNSENAVVDKDNILIHLSHVRTAAVEIPLSINDVALFPDLGEFIPVLISENELFSRSGKYVWQGEGFPAGDFSIRNIDKVRYKLINKADNSVVAEMDEMQAFRELYDHAIYMHEGLSYYVESLDRNAHCAICSAANENYYTEPNSQSIIKIIDEKKKKAYNRTAVAFGDLNVNSVISGFKKVQFHNKQNLGYEMLPEPLCKDMDTEGVWIILPNNIREVLDSITPTSSHYKNTNMYSYYDALSFVLNTSSMMISPIRCSAD